MAIFTAIVYPNINTGNTPLADTEGETSTEVSIVEDDASGFSSLTTMPSCRTHSFIIYCVFGGSTSIFGLVGNVLTMVVFRKDIKNSATIFLLFCLSIADSFVLLTYGSMTFSRTFAEFLNWTVVNKNLKNFAFAYVSGVSNTALLTAIWLTVSVTWMRYINVCKPYKAKTLGSLKMAKIQVLIVIAFSFVMSIPRLLRYRVYLNTPEPGHTLLVPTGLTDNRIYQILYDGVLYYLFYYILPLGALIYMTTALMLALREAQKKREKMIGTNTKDEKSKRELTLSLIVVVIIFMVCHFLTPILRILRIYNPKPSDRACGTFYYAFNEYVILALLVSSSINIIIYVAFVKRFRGRLMEMCHRKETVRQSNLETMDTTPVSASRVSTSDNLTRETSNMSG